MKEENSHQHLPHNLDEAMLLEFSSFISVKRNMFLTKVQQSYYYTKLCNYKEEFVLKPISNIPNILVCCS